MNQLCTATPLNSFHDDKKHITANEREIVREKIRLLKQGKSVVVTPVELSILEQSNLRSSFHLEIVSIPNPGQVGTKDAFLAGYIFTPEIEEYRLKHGLECQQQVNLLREISRVSGHSLAYVYSLREGMATGKDKQTELELLLEQWQWRASITQMPTHIDDLDLTTKDGLMRAIQLQQCLDIKSSNIKHAKKYYADFVSRQAVYIEKIENDYHIDIANPLRVACDVVADAILNRDSSVLIPLFVDGIYTSCEKVFDKATGFKISRLSRKNKTTEIMRWANTE